MYPLLAESSTKLIRKFWYFLCGSSVLLAIASTLFRSTKVYEPLPNFFQWYIIGISTVFFVLALAINRFSIAMNNGQIAAVDRKGSPLKDPEQQILLMVILAYAGLDLISLGGFFLQWRSGVTGPGVPYFITSLVGFILTFPAPSKLKGRSEI